jgi:hypothetical protein
VTRTDLLVATLALCLDPVHATSPPESTRFFPVASSRKDPFGKLFDPATRPAPGRRDTPAPESESRTKPKIACGMVMIPTDPAFDSRIRLEVPRSDTTYTIRSIPPPVCRRE